MKKERKCKCGADLEKGKQKCETCRKSKGQGARGKEKHDLPPAAPAEAGLDGRNIITIDLNQRPDVQMRIREQARENFRTVELQVLYLLSTMEAR